MGCLLWLSMIGSNNMKKKVTTGDLQDIRARYQVASMWATISPNWGLLHKQLSCERWKCKRLDVLKVETNQTNTQPQQTTKTPPQKRRRHPVNEVRQKPTLSDQNITVGALSSSSRRHSKIPQINKTPRCLLSWEIFLHTSQSLNRWNTLVHPRPSRCRCAR